MATKTLVVLLLSFIIVINSVHSIPPINNATVEFIRTSCDSTLYPTLCFSSLVPYADIVDRDPVRLAHLAINVTRARVRSVALHVSALRRAPPGPMPPRMSGALQDCSETLSTAIDQTYMSATELGSLEKYDGPETAWRVFNVQTWMSAAMTNEQTCSDGLGGGGGGGGGVSEVRDDVCGRVSQAMEHTSIALALVNCLVSN